MCFKKHYWDISFWKSRIGSRRNEALSLDGDMTGASRGQLVNVDEETSLSVAGIERQHAVVHVFLQALAPVARSQRAASGFWEKASLQSLGLGVVGHFLDDDTPFTVDVLGADGTGVGDVAGADESLATDPVALIELFAVVERIVEFLFLLFGDSVD